MSTGLVPNTGEEQIAKLLLNTAAPENLVLRLFKNDITPTSTMTLTDYTEATFTGYSAVTLSSGSWNVSSSDTAYAEYSAGVPFTCSQTTSENVYGFYLTGAASSTLYWSERFSSAPRIITYVGDALSPRPKITLACDTGVVPSTLLNGLVSYWSLDETSGTRADSVGGNHLSDDNTVGYDTGINGNAASFVAGNNEYLSKTPFSLSDTCSLSLWFTFTAAGVNGIFLVGNGDYSSDRFCIYTASGLVVETRDGLGGPEKNVHTYAGLVDGSWNHIYVQYDNHVASCSLNGGELFSATANTADWAVDRIILGAIGSPAFPGTELIDEVGLWSRVLTEDERAKLYNSGDGFFYPFT